MLNSFLDKFGQQSNMSQIELVDEPSVYFDKLTSDKEEVTATHSVSNEVMEMRWKYSKIKVKKDCLWKQRTH